MTRRLAFGAAMLLGGCIEAAQAQPVTRSDGGVSTTRPRSRRPSSHRVGALQRTQALRLITSLSDPDAGAHSLLGSAAGLGVEDGIGGIGVRLARSDAGLTPGALGALRALRGGVPGLGGLGTRGGVTALGGLTAGRASYGGLGVRQRDEPARFDELSVVGPVPSERVAVGLRVAGQVASRCLATAGYTSPTDVAVRFTVRSPGVVDELSVQSAPEVVERCVRASLARAPFAPGATPTEVSAWFRAGTRVAIGPVPR